MRLTPDLSHRIVDQYPTIWSPKHQNRLSFLPNPNHPSVSYYSDSHRFERLSFRTTIITATHNPILSISYSPHLTECSLAKPIGSSPTVGLRPSQERVTFLHLNLICICNYMRVAMRIGIAKSGATTKFYSTGAMFPSLSLHIPDCERCRPQ